MSEKEPADFQPAALGGEPIDDTLRDVGIDETEPVGAIDLPRGWKYKRFSLFGFQLPWYASPRIQLLMVAFVCFMCPGMFNALGGLGGGGKINPTLADDMVSGKPSFKILSGLILTTRRIRTRLSTVHSLSSASLAEPSSTESVSDGLFLSEALDTAFMRSACWSRSKRMFSVSTSLLVLGLVSAPVFCGRRRVRSWSPIQMKARRATILPGSGASSTWELSSAVWYVCPAYPDSWNSSHISWQPLSAHS
jgi:hypothetical protein